MKKYKKNYFIFIAIFFLFSMNAEANGNKEFLSLKNNEVNLRLGPSFEYPIKLIYKKKYLPVTIIDRSDVWIKIMDFEKNSGWIHTSQLSKKKSGINIKNNSIIYKKPKIYSKPLARMELGRLVLIKKCELKWCKIKTGNHVGWVRKSSLWGII